MASETEINLTSSFTIEAWVKPESFATGGNMNGIVSKYHSNGVPAYSLRLINGKVNFSTNDGLANEVTSSNTLPLNQWTHVVATYSSTDGSISVFINGVQDGTKTAATLAVNGTDLRIGVDFDNRFFDGGIDDVRIWSVAKTAAQIAQQKDIELIGNEAGLEAYWKLDSVDESGYTRDLAGTLNNVGINFGATIVNGTR